MIEIIEFVYQIPIWLQVGIIIVSLLFSFFITRGISTKLIFKFLALVGVIFSIIFMVSWIFWDYV